VGPAAVGAERNATQRNTTQRCGWHACVVENLFFFVSSSGRCGCDKEDEDGYDGIVRVREREVRRTGGERVVWYTTCSQSYCLLCAVLGTCGWSDGLGNEVGSWPFVWRDGRREVGGLQLRYFGLSAHLVVEIGYENCSVGLVHSN
jgi:hypothetical protein